MAKQCNGHCTFDSRSTPHTHTHIYTYISISWYGPQIACVFNIYFWGIQNLFFNIFLPFG